MDSDWAMSLAAKQPLQQRRRLRLEGPNRKLIRYEFRS